MHIAMHNFKPSVVLDKRRLSTVGDNKDKYHIKLRITFKAHKKGKTVWIQKYFKTGLFCTEKEFNAVMGNPRTTELTEIKKQVVKIQAKANDIITNNATLTPSLFEREFTGKGGYDNVVSFFDTIINRKESEGDIGTAASYKQAKSSFVKFGGDSISFAEVDPDWLARYEKDML